MKTQEILDRVDQETLDNIAQALWLPELKTDQLPQNILACLVSEKNSNKAFGERMQFRLRDMLAHPDSFTPSYRKRYKTFLQYTTALTPHQAYVMTNLLGMDSSRGYQEIPPKANFHFPHEDAPQLGYQLGWHFFVGSCTGQNGQEYGVEFMFWQYSILPPPLARQLGLSDWENQILEMHLAVSVAGDKHYRAKPIVIAGTTGLLNFIDDPYRYTFGKNLIESERVGSLFPLRLRGKGWNLGLDKPMEIDVELMLASAKDYFLQGDKGCSPSVGGVGTLYYSVPNIKIDPTKSWLALNGEKVQLTGGKFWYDHQWTTGLGPAGSPRVALLRASKNLSQSGPGGWDWFMAQFDDDREITVAAMHINENLAFYEQSGLNPPGIMTAPLTGKFIDRDGKARDLDGSLQVTEWVKSECSPDPDQYPVTHTWYPNHWVFHFGSDVPDGIRNFHMAPIVQKGQSGFFASGAQYSEGAVYLEDEQGQHIGRGFAESVMYANTTRNIIKLAGLPDTPEMLDLIKQPAPSFLLKLWSLLYVAWPPHKAELERLLVSYTKTLGHKMNP